jgi:MarR family transcriptional regulator, organic hydroperoxide resistance regulator
MAKTKAERRRIFFAAAQRVTRLQEQTLAALEQPLTGRQYRVLARVNEGHTSPTALATLARRSMPSISESIEGLVRRGLLERTASTTDRRAVVLALTEQGHLALKDADKHVDALGDQLLAAIPKDHHTSLADDLEAIFNAAEHRLAKNTRMH